MSQIIRVLIVDDSLSYRKLIKRAIEVHPLIEVVGCAGNADEAQKGIAELHPDLLTMDIEMPGTDGLTLLKHLMKKDPVRVIMVSSLTGPNAHETMAALEAGALDVVKKPGASREYSYNEMAADLRQKILHCSKVKLSLLNHPPALSVPVSDHRNAPIKKGLILIGASTGGVRAIQSIVSTFTRNLPPVVIVQHMPPGFTKSFAHRLDELSQCTVKEAEDGDPLRTGWVYIAPGGRQLRLKTQNGGWAISLGESDPVGGHCPAINVMFHSAAEILPPKAMAILMTGMGEDGAAGMAQLKKCGVRTIAQNRETSVVYGMPRAAVLMGAAVKELPLQEIPEEIHSYFCSPSVSSS